MIASHITNQRSGRYGSAGPFGDFSPATAGPAGAAVTSLPQLDFDARPHDRDPVLEEHLNDLP